MEGLLGFLVIYMFVFVIYTGLLVQLPTNYFPKRLQNLFDQKWMRILCGFLWPIATVLTGIFTFFESCLGIYRYLTSKEESK